MLLNLYKSLIRPVLEYGNTVWGPHFVLDQRAIERVQIKDVLPSLLLGFVIAIGYTESLHSLNLPSLYYRKTRGDMIILYRMLHVDDNFTVDVSVFYITHKRSQFQDI